MQQLIRTANRRWDGHFTVMKFTTNWRVCFTPMDRDDGKTFGEAAARALTSDTNVWQSDTE